MNPLKYIIGIHGIWAAQCTETGVWRQMEMSVGGTGGPGNSPREKLYTFPPN